MMLLALEKVPSFIHNTYTMEVILNQKFNISSFKPLFTFSESIENFIDTDLYKKILNYLCDNKQEDIYDRFLRFIQSRCPYIEFPEFPDQIREMNDEQQIILILGMQYFFFTY